MKRIEIKLSLPVVAPLLDIIKEATDRASKRLVVPLEGMDLDADMGEVWAADLQTSQNQEFKILLGLFDSQFFASGVIVLDVSNAEAILRASAAVRLLLREHNLKAFPDESLEGGDVEVDELPTYEQKSFMGYLFLATLQELIIQHLDRAILGTDEDNEEGLDEGQSDSDDKP